MVHANDRAIFGVFIVPQKVYMAQGSLADQITYPLHLLPSFRTSEVLSLSFHFSFLNSNECLFQEEEHLRTLMELVGVGYLVDREGWDVTMKWQDILSLGEQQRIGMARLFYHRPQFGILDECTSAVSVDVEEKLYRAAKEIGITCITISQRLALQVCLILCFSPFPSCSQLSLVFRNFTHKSYDWERQTSTSGHSTL